MLLAYGICLHHYSSRREANEMTAHSKGKSQALFPELETLPHGDTLYRLLERIEVERLKNTDKATKRMIENKSL